MVQNDLPPGFRFVPKEDELIGSYLRSFCNGDQRPLNIIPFIDNLYEHPNNLKTVLEEKRCSSGYFKFSHGNEWYFFSKRKQKSESDRRIIRSIDGGHWKRTNPSGGKKEVFTFYEVDDKDKKTKTDWIMHQYTLDGEQTHKNMCVVCKLYNSKRSCEDYDNNDDQFVSESSNVDDTKTVSIELSDANLSPAKYQLEHCNNATAVCSPFSGQLSQCVTSNAPQAMEGNDYLTAMNVEHLRLVQHPFPAHAALPSTPCSSSQITASLGIHPTAAYCNQAISWTAQVSDTLGVDNCDWMDEYREQQVSEAYMHDEDPLQTFQEQLNEEVKQWLASQLECFQLQEELESMQS